MVQGAQNNAADVDRLYVKTNQGTCNIKLYTSYSVSDSQLEMVLITVILRRLVVNVSAINSFDAITTVHKTQCQKFCQWLFRVNYDSNIEEEFRKNVTL